MRGEVLQHRVLPDIVLLVAHSPWAAVGVRSGCKGGRGSSSGLLAGRVAGVCQAVGLSVWGVTEPLAMRHCLLPADGTRIVTRSAWASVLTLFRQGGVLHVTHELLRRLRRASCCRTGTMGAFHSSRARPSATTTARLPRPSCRSGARTLMQRRCVPQCLCCAGNGRQQLWL